MKYDPLMYNKCKNNKQRKIANIRVRNSLNKIYLDMKVSGQINDFKIIGVKIKNRIQYGAINLIPIMPTENIIVNIGFKTLD